MSGRAKKKPFQVTLTTVLLALVSVSVYVGVVATLPAIALPTLPVAAFVTIVTFLLIHVEHSLEPTDPAQRPAIGSCVLISISAWTLSFVAISSLKLLPGSFGPVQYAGANSLAMFVFRLRLVTLLAMVAAPILCSVFGAVRASMGMRVRLDWLAVGAGLYLIAWIVLFWNPWFIPTV